MGSTVEEEGVVELGVVGGAEEDGATVLVFPLLVVDGSRTVGTGLAVVVVSSS